MKTKNIKVRDHDGDVTKVSFAPVPPVGSGKHCKPKIRRLVQKSGAAVLSLPVLARVYPHEWVHGGGCAAVCQC